MTTVRFGQNPVLVEVSWFALVAASIVACSSSGRLKDLEAAPAGGSAAAGGSGGTASTVVGSAGFDGTGGGGGDFATSSGSEPARGGGGAASDPALPDANNGDESALGSGGDMGTIGGSGVGGGSPSGGNPDNRGGSSIGVSSSATGGSASGGTASAAAGSASGGTVSAAAGSASGGTATTGGSPLVGSTPQIPSPPLPTIESDSFTPSTTTTDIADDSAIYANPNAPELSVVIADNKDDTTGGVGVFDMQGKLLQFRQDGKIGNVDLRPGFPLGGQQIVLVGANNRTTNTLIFWQLDPATRQLSAPIGDTISTTSPNYGFCLYHSATSGKFYAFVTQETGTAMMEQYELGESAGKVTATKVRSFEVGSITEGCVADDELGRLYVAQEDVALWRYGAEPSTGSDRIVVGSVGDGQLVADLEGVSLAKGPGTSGYLVLSIQSESRFVTYDRETNAFIWGFTVGANGSIDATTQTDGLDISTSDLGPGFPSGALVVHDGSNSGGVSSNLKYIPLQ